MRCHVVSMFFVAFLWVFDLFGGYNGWVPNFDLVFFRDRDGERLACLPGTDLEP